MVTKKGTARTVRSIAITVGVLLLILIIAGLVYTWIVGRTTVVKPVAVTATPTTSPTAIKHVEPGPNVPEGVAVQSLTSPVMPGDNASIIIQTNPGSWCTITVVYNNVPSKDSGLVGKTSDDFGSVSWSWTVGKDVPLGSWPVTVTCLRNKFTGVAGQDLVVSNTIPTN